MRKTTKIIIIAAIIICAIAAATVYNKHGQNQNKDIEPEEYGVMQIYSEKNGEDTSGSEEAKPLENSSEYLTDPDEQKKAAGYSWGTIYYNALFAEGEAYQSSLEMLAACLKDLNSKVDLSSLNTLYETADKIEMSEGIPGDIIFFVADDSSIADVGIMAGHNDVFIVSDGIVVKELASKHGKNMVFGRLFAIDNTATNLADNDYFETSAAVGGYIHPEVLLGDDVDATPFDANLEDLGICVSDYISSLEFEVRPAQLVVESADTTRFDQFCFITVLTDGGYPIEVRYWYDSKTFDIVY